MAYLSPFVKVQIIGDCFSGQEQWTTQFCISATTLPSSAVLLTQAEGIAARWTTFFTAAGAGYSAQYRTLSIKMNVFGTDGKQITDPTVEYVLPTPAVGGAAGTGNPPQCTLVLSLRSTVDRGAGTKGRMYLPITTPTISTDGRLASATITAILALAKTFFNGVSLDTNAAFGGVPSLVSPVLTGQQRAITRLLMGRVYDTQRRRRGNLEEGYVALAL